MKNDVNKGNNKNKWQISRVCLCYLKEYVGKLYYEFMEHY